MTLNKSAANPNILKKETFKQFIKYSLCAAVATVVDVSILYSLTEFAGVWYFYSAAFSYVGGVTANFTLNKFFTFKNYDKRFLKQYATFWAVAIVGLALNQIIIYVLVEFAGLFYLLAKAISIALVVSWSFFGHRKFTFKTPKLEIS